MTARRWVLGVNPGPHDGSAALLRDGQLVAMAEQERFSRNKQADWETPLDPIEHCLAEAGLKPDDLDAVALGLDVERFLDWLGLAPAERAAFDRIDGRERLFPVDRWGETTVPIHRVAHHLAHAASAFRASGHDEAAIVVVDNRGEDASATVAHGTAKGIEILRTMRVEDSLGLYYRTATEYTGLGGSSSQSGKFMGLASYGRPSEPVPVEVVDGWPAFVGLPALRGATAPERRDERTEQFRAFFETNCFPYEAGCAAEIMAYANVAASVQQSLERSLEALWRYAKEQTGSRHLCLAGGVSLNCSANGRLAALGIYDDVFVQPASSDAGTSLGAALEVDVQLGPGQTVPFVQEHAQWGPAFSDDEIAAALDAAGVDYERVDGPALAGRVATLLADDHVVGWYQGRAEIGPRALGARSILGNPARRSTANRINVMKGRELWRPLAPSVTEEAYSTYFDGPQRSRFMLVAVQVRPEHRHALAAVTHVDGTARPQAVSRRHNPRYWEVLDHVGSLTGHPVVLNTSFNVAGEPIVHTPAQAIADFLGTSMDALAIGNHLARKRR